MSLDHILLGLLRKPAAGYDLKTGFETNIRNFWSAELSQIYPALQRLEKQGLLRSRVEPSPKGPNRRVYTRTAAGRRHFVRWLQDNPQVGTERFAYLAQLYFMDELGDLTQTRRFLVTLRNHFTTWVESLREIEQEIRSTHGDAPERYSERGIHQFAALRMGVHSIGAKVAWCDETIATIDASVDHSTSPQKQEV